MKHLQTKHNIYVLKQCAVFTIPLQLQLTRHIHIKCWFSGRDTRDTVTRHCTYSQSTVGYMCCFPKCITYISQVYSPSVNARKPWKISILLSEVHELLLCDSPLNFTDFVSNEHRRADARQTDGAQWNRSAITLNIHFSELFVVGQ